ncbi:MAG: hypothetical protein ACTSSL_13295 [Candidatus Heimdallarchaeaceae archaeon]
MPLLTLFDDKFKKIHYLAVLFKINGLKRYSPSTQPTNIGTFYHMLLESVLSNNFELVEYYYYYEKMTVEESFFSALNECRKDFSFLMV